MDAADAENAEAIKAEMTRIMVFFSIISLVKPDAYL